MIFFCDRARFHIYLHWTQMNFLVAKEVIQWVTVLVCNHEDLSSNPSTM